MRLIILIGITISVLSGCATPQQMIDQNRIYPGMNKGTLRSVMIEMNFADDITFEPCFRRYFSEVNYEVLSSSSRNTFYIFENVTVPTTGCGLQGNGSLVEVYNSYDSAVSYIRKRIGSEQVVNADTAKSRSSTGCIEGNCENGYGVWVWADGSRHEGYWVNNKQHGKGVLTIYDGRRYEGDFWKGKHHGKGVWTFPNGDRYEGGFVDNKMHGKGVYTWGPGEWEGDRYEGDYVDGEIHGKGVLTKANGYRYEGDFVDGGRTGKAVVTYSDGARYEGDYVDGKRHGRGINTNSDGTVRAGIWQDDELVEEVVLQDENALRNVSSGTGFFINNNGYLISNYHVVEICQEVKTQLSGKTYGINILASDKANDLVIGKIESSKNEFLPISSEGAYLGDEIIVAGFPYSDVLSDSVKITSGIISSMSGLGNNYSLLQIDAAVQSGNSGGPLLNSSGEVVGVTVSKLDATKILEERGEIPENINFAVKSENLTTFLRANQVNFIRSNSVAKMSRREVASNAQKATIFLQCYNSIANLKKIMSGEQKVSRQLFVDF